MELKMSFIDDAKKIASAKNGRCLSRHYVNSTNKLLWECGFNHTWYAVLKSVRNGSWCPTCYNISRGSKRRRWSIKRIREEIAALRGGDVLSQFYTNTTSKLVWKCSDGHIWKATLRCVYGSKNRTGTWCPTCSNINNTRENICRKLFEFYLNAKFPNSRPSFLQGLELDGYCKNLNLAFEYNGIHHYKQVNFYFGNTANVQRNDRTKQELCKENNVTLIIIPYTIDDLDCCIRENLAKLGFNITKEKAPLFSGKSIRLENLQKICSSRDGRCLDSVYINNRTKMLFECKFGHTWKTNPVNILNKNRWCPECGKLASGLKRRKWNIDKIRLIANERDGELLSTEYKTYHDSLLWRCTNLHEWKASLSSIVNNNSWCPICRREKREIKVV